MLTFQEFKSAVNQYGLTAALSIASHLITLDQALVYTTFIAKG